MFFFSHMLDFKHTFNFSQATLIKPIQCKNFRQLLESSVISLSKHILLDFTQLGNYNFTWEW